MDIYRDGIRVCTLTEDELREACEELYGIDCLNSVQEMLSKTSDEECFARWATTKENLTHFAQDISCQAQDYERLHGMPWESAVDAAIRTVLKQGGYFG